MDDEKEALEAIYETDFEARVDPRDGRPSWRISLAGHGATFIVKLPPGYPESEAPAPGLEFDQWPVGGDAFAQRMVAELLGLWERGEGCVYQWTEHVKEALACGPPELTGAHQSPGGADHVDAGAADDGSQPAGSGSVPLPAAVAEAVGPSLQAAGFASCGPGVWSNGDSGVTVEVGEELAITVDGIDADDLVDWASMQLAADVGSFGTRLVEWVTAQRAAEPGFSEDAGGVDDDEGLDFLPSAEELGVKKERDLLIYTWGKAIRKAAPSDSEHNFNAGILNGRGGGADLRTMNGLSDEVQNNVASCNLFPRWISMVCAKVEHSDLHTISINCTKGRHRSVAAAEILRRLYYPHATVRHLTIY